MSNARPKPGDSRIRIGVPKAVLLKTLKISTRRSSERDSPREKLRDTAVSSVASPSPRKLFRPTRPTSPEFAIRSSVGTAGVEIDCFYAFWINRQTCGLVQSVREVSIVVPVDRGIYSKRLPPPWSSATAASFQFPSNRPVPGSSQTRNPLRRCRTSKFADARSAPRSEMSCGR